MKKGWYIFLLFVPALLFSQENHSKKPKFYDRIQLIPEYQVGVHKDYYMGSSHPISPWSGPSYFEETSKYLTSYIGGNLFFKNSYLIIGTGFSGTFFWNSPRSYNTSKLQTTIGGNLLFFTKAAKNRSRLYLGPAFTASWLFYNKRNIPLMGIGADFSFYNIYIRFSYQYFQIENSPPTEYRDRLMLFSIGYGFDLNTFRKKENKRFDL